MYAACMQAQEWLQGLQMRQLTYLELSIAPVDRDAVRGLMQALQDAPHTEDVYLTAFKSNCQEGWVQSLLSAPTRGSYWCKRMQIVEEQDEQFFLELEKRGFVIDMLDDDQLYVGYKDHA